MQRFAIAALGLEQVENALGRVKSAMQTLALELEPFLPHVILNGNKCRDLASLFGIKAAIKSRGVALRNASAGSIAC